MKIRAGFVSNSSSSSYVVVGAVPENLNCVALVGEQREHVLKFLGLTVDDNSNVSLTEYVSDGVNIEFDKHDYHVYDDGAFRNPYDIDNYVELTGSEESGVWIKKEHYSPDGIADFLKKLIEKEIFERDFCFTAKGSKIFLKDKKTKKTWEIKNVGRNS